MATRGDCFRAISDMLQRAQPRVLRRVRLEVEVAGDHRRRRPDVGLERPAVVHGHPAVAGVGVAVGVDGAQGFDLRHPLAR